MSDDENTTPDDNADTTAEESQDTEQTLDQESIDSMMGEDAASSEEKTISFDSVEEEIIHRSMLNYERLPMLDVIFDRFVLSLANSLKTATAANVDAEVSYVDYMSYGAAINSVPVPGLLTVVDAAKWQGNFLIAMDATFVHSALEIMFGGRQSPPANAEGRTFTSIERRIGMRLSSVMLDDLQESFSQLTDIEFKVDRTETNAQFATISQYNAPCVQVKLQVTLDGRTGDIMFIIPYATIEPIRKLLSKVFFGEKLGGDRMWHQHMEDKVRESSAELRAVMHEVDVKLKDLLDWNVGQTVDLMVTADHEPTLFFEKIPLFKGTLGQKKNSSIAIRISEDFETKENLTDANDFADL